MSAIEKTENDSAADKKGAKGSMAMDHFGRNGGKGAERIKKGRGLSELIASEGSAMRKPLTKQRRVSTLILSSEQLPRPLGI